MENKKDHLEKSTLKLIINGEEHEWSQQYITGSEVRKLGRLDDEAELFLKIKEPWQDETILNDTNVDLARPGIEHFFSKERTVEVIIVVNGRQKSWNERYITFEQVVTLAFGSYVPDPNRVFTVTYKGGPEVNQQGTMVVGDKVKAKNKMIFNVTATDKS